MLTYDAWDRLVAYQTPSFATGDDPRYAYDALHRRTHRRLTDTLQSRQPTDTTRFFYSTQWQVIYELTQHAKLAPPPQTEAERANAGSGGGVDDPHTSLPGSGDLPDPTTSPESIQLARAKERIAYVWSAVYVDAMVLRDRDLHGDGTYDERLYVQQDANYNPASLSDISGVVVERLIFDPYGVATFLDPNWTVDSAGSDDAWTHLHQGGRQDPLTGLVHFRFRDYAASLGRWTQPDPAGYVDGANLYLALLASPLAWLDPLGLGSDRSPFHPGEPEPGSVTGGSTAAGVVGGDPDGSGAAHPSAHGHASAGILYHVPNNAIVAAADTVKIAVGGAFGMIGATIGEACIYPVRRLDEVVGGKPLIPKNLRDRTMWGHVWDGCEEAMIRTWEH